MHADSVPPMMYREDEVLLFLAAAFLLLVTATLIRQVPLKEQLSSFFNFTTPKELTEVESNNMEWVRRLTMLMTCLLGALLYYRYALEQWDFLFFPLQTWQLLAIYSCIFLCIIVLKQWLLASINSIFFDNHQRNLWRRDYAIIFSLESILFFLLTTLTIFLNLSLKKAFIGLVLLLLFVKFLVFTKDFTHFFRNFYGVLHLFLYFCALEAAPLLVLWATLDRLTNHLTTTL